MSGAASPPDDAGKPEGEPAADPQPEQSAAQLAAETLGHDLLAALVDELERMPAAWAALSQHQQDNAIRRGEVAVRKLVTDALAILFQGTYPACRAVLESITIKDGIKATLKIGRTEHHLLELTEHVGTPVVVILHDPQAYFDHMEKIRGEKEQRPLPFGEETAGGAPADEGQPPAGGPLNPDPDAPAPAAPEDLELERDPLWKQAVDQLAEVGVQVDPEKAKTWSVDQLTEASYFAQILKSGKKAKVPKFVREAVIDPGAGNS